jgi:hypothetical protein
MNVGDLLLLAFALGVAVAVAIAVHPRKPAPRHDIARGFGGPSWTETDITSGFGNQTYGPGAEARYSGDGTPL